eukprot:jgi/Ulvmu1/2246/UM013_0093.1
MHAERPSGGIGGFSGRFGDNFVSGSEECEPPNTAVCSSRCVIITPDPSSDCPSCPNTPDCPPPGACGPDCTFEEPSPAPSCGDLIVQPEAGEECEPPSEGNCDDDCKIVPPSPPPDTPAPVEPSCGDLIVQLEAGEECEPPSEGSCDDDCKIVPRPTTPTTPAPDYGDLIVRPDAGEECEPPSEGNCDENCKIVIQPTPTPSDPSCGDLIVQPEAGEECEPPEVGDCGPDCKIIVPPPPPECGRRTVQEPEECEPSGVGNCDENCRVVAPPQAPFCGDGTVQDGEECNPPQEGVCNADCTAVTLVPSTPPPRLHHVLRQGWQAFPGHLHLGLPGPAPGLGLRENDGGPYDPTTGVLVGGSGNKKLGGDIKISHNGIENELHVSCSSELGPGLRTQTSGQDKKCQDSCDGCFVVTDLQSDQGGEFCPFCNLEFLEQAAAGLPIG